MRRTATEAGLRTQRMLSPRNFYSFLAPFEGLKCLSEPNRAFYQSWASANPRGQSFILPGHCELNFVFPAGRDLLLLVGRRPAEAGGDRRAIIFALMEVLLAAKVKPEHFVGQV